MLIAHPWVRSTASHFYVQYEIAMPFYLSLTHDHDWGIEDSPVNNPCLFHRLSAAKAILMYNSTTFMFYVDIQVKVTVLSKPENISGKMNASFFASCHHML